MKTKPIKIGLDARMFSDAFTGIGRYNFELTKRLFARKELNGRALEWVIFLNQPQFDTFTFPAHVKKVCVNAEHYSLKEQTNFCWLLYKERCDFIHFTHFNLPLLYWRPFVVTIHDTTISFYPGKKMNVWWRKLAYQLVIRHAVNASKQIITVSKHTAADVIELFRVRPEKLHPIHIAPSPEFKLSAPETVQAVLSDLNIKPSYLLYTGNWREHKNLVGLIKAFAQLKKNQALPGLQLVITGKADPHYPEVMETITALKLEPHIKLVGLVDLESLIALFTGASVYVCPSFYEGFGLPPLEAMACDTPVAVSKAASLPEVCGQAALYFDPHKIETMTEQIQKLLTDKELAETLREKGREQAGHFSWDQTAQATFKLYQTLL